MLFTLDKLASLIWKKRVCGDSYGVQISALLLLLDMHKLLELPGVRVLRVTT